MGKNITILIEISALVSVVNLLITLYSCIPKILINQYWVDLIVCIVFMLLDLLLGGYIIGALFENIKRKLK